MRFNLISSADQEGGASGEIDEQARVLLSPKRIAFAGVSRSGASAANSILLKLRDRGHDVFPVNPSATELEGMDCHPDILSVSGGVDGVVTVTTPQLIE
jgi:predicted CoA-binding protein